MPIATRAGAREGGIRRPIMRIHGGKFRLAPRIIAQFPVHKIYIEPFAGGASILLRKPLSFAEVINDVDGDLINVFRVLRDGSKAERLRELLELTPWARSEFDLCYEPSADDVEQARRTIARSFMAFGTTHRREGMTGFRSRAYRQRQTEQRSWREYPKNIVKFVDRLRDVNIENRDAIELIDNFDRASCRSEVFYFCDPPYPIATRSSMKGRQPTKGRGAYLRDLTDDDHRDLAARLRAISGMAIVSGYACDLYDKELYPDWERLTLKTMADGGQPRTEVLWVNPAASAARRQVREAAA